MAERTGNQVRKVLDATADPATPAQQLPVLAPTLRRTAVVERVRGTVSVRPRGKKKFVRLTDPALVRLGSEIDTERGVARVTVATDAKGTLGPATVRGGRFVVTQGKRLEAHQPAGAVAQALVREAEEVQGPRRHSSPPISAKRRKSRRLWVNTRPSATAPRAATPRAPCAARAG